MVERDIEVLDNDVKLIKWFANKRVAHRDKMEAIKPPKYDDLDLAIDSIEKLTIRYGQMLKGSMPQVTLPEWQYDWKQIFRGAWLE